MRSCTARALLALVLLAVALEAVPTEQQATVIQSLTLTATFNIEPGDAVAPHIYDWYFDGVDDYVRVPNNPSLVIPNEITVIAWAQYYPTNSFATIVGKGFHGGGFAISKDQSNKVFFSVANDNVVQRWWINNGDMSGLMAFYAGVSKLGYTALYVNDKLYGPASNTNPPYINNTYDLYVGGRGFWSPMGMYRGYISMAMLYTRALSDSEIARAYNANIVSANGLVLFLDATFYNGTRYIDLSGRGNHGVGYGGVSRVLSSRPGLYLVKGLHSDGLVHFRFFPANTLVEVYDGSGSLVTWFVITGSANRAGLVEDYTVSLGPGSYRLAVYTTVYVQVAQPALPASKLVVAHFKAEMGPGCRVYIDYTAWPKAEPRTECGLQTDAVFLTGLPAGATVRVWNETVLYEVIASSTGVAVLGGLKPGAYEVKVYSDTLQIPHDHLLRLDPLAGLRQFFGFWDRLTFNLFTPVFVVGLVLAVYLRTWSTVLTALVALAAHIVIAPDNIWIRGLLALALAVAVYIAMWRRTTLI
jgi:hypothetical protein